MIAKISVTWKFNELCLENTAVKLRAVQLILTDSAVSSITSQDKASRSSAVEFMVKIKKGTYFEIATSYGLIKVRCCQ